MRAPSILAPIACLMGAAGVVAAALAGHAGGSDLRWSSAAQMLLAHAAASLAATAFLWKDAQTTATVRHGVLVAAVIGMQAGACLFAADMAARSLLAQALFPLAAPIGGTMTIAAWLLAAAAFLLPWPKR